MERIELLFDCLRAPYDASHIIQVAMALGNCDLYLSGRSLDLNNKKVLSKIHSWGIPTLPHVKIFETFDEAVETLHREGRYLVGTMPGIQRTIYEIDFTKGNLVVVFGTESSGLGKRKMDKLDDIVSIPMSNSLQFLTLTVAVPIVAYEFYRQLQNKK